MAWTWHECELDLCLLWNLGNLEASQSLQALTVFSSLLCLPSNRVRRVRAMFIDVVAAMVFAGLLFVLE